MLKGMDVFSGAVWGGSPNSEMRVPTPGEAQGKVLAALLKTPFNNERRNPRDWFISLVIHAVVVAALVIPPLIGTQTIDLRSLQVTHLVALTPSAPTPPPAAALIQKVAPRKTVPLIPVKLAAPVFIPRKVVVGARDDVAPDISGGVIGGVPGGTPGGVLGGILGGTSTTEEVLPVAPPAIEAKKKGILRTGGDLKPPRVLFAPKPNYPLIARQAHVQGAVIIDAIVDENGNVVNARAVDGCPLLIPEALRTVMLWKYEPTYLNGVAYPVALTATVTFALGS